MAGSDCFRFADDPGASVWSLENRGTRLQLAAATVVLSLFLLSDILPVHATATAGIAEACGWWRANEKVGRVRGLLCAWAANAQSPLKYGLFYSSAGMNAVQVRIDLPSPRSVPVVLVCPATIPAGTNLSPTIPL